MSDRLFNWNAIAGTLIRHRVSYRQFSYWDERGLLAEARSKPGSGYHRDVPWRAVALACAIGDLLQLGFTLEAAARIAKLLEGGGHWRFVSPTLSLEVQIILEREPADADT